MTTASAATRRNCCARSKQLSTSLRIRVKCARRSGPRAPRRSSPRSTWSARSSGEYQGPGKCRGRDSQEDAMLDNNMKTQLQGYLERISQPVEIVASLDDSEKSQEMLELLNDIESVSSLVTVDAQRDSTQVKPSFALR